MAAPQYTRTPPCGPVSGVEVHGVARFTGIPYAKASRFQKPRPVEKWTDALNATKPCPACPQPKDLILNVDLAVALGSSEECQRLSITAPVLVVPSASLKVMVWIHGGSFLTGAGDASIYDPSTLVIEHNIIVVNITYRLGLFGYLGDQTSRPANLGLFDLLQALRWVNKNISAFGGSNDPASITVFGQSAGGAAIADLLLVPESRALFRRAIIQSSPFGIRLGRSKMYEALLAKCQGISVASSSDEVVEMGDKLTEEGLKWGLEGGMVFAPQYGQEPLPDEEQITVKMHDAAPHFEVLIGTTAHETTLFLDKIPATAWLIDLPVVGSLFHSAISWWSTRVIYSNGAKELASLLTQAGGSASVYVIDWAPNNGRLGSTHAAELPLLLGDCQAWTDVPFIGDSKWENVDQLGKRLRSVWVAFASGATLKKQDSVEGLIKVWRP
ncbi:hypothetical protein LTR85_007540 [Meristemomyces frigidus]|nr:hypothetical protein LTR85_007540 [Meristemomyces frigidus]